MFICNFNCIRIFLQITLQQRLNHDWIFTIIYNASYYSFFYKILQCIDNTTINLIQIQMMLFLSSFGKTKWSVWFYLQVFIIRQKHYYLQKLFKYRMFCGLISQNFYITSRSCYNSYHLEQCIKWEKNNFNYHFCWKIC